MVINSVSATTIVVKPLFLLGPDDVSHSDFLEESLRWLRDLNRLFHCAAAVDIFEGNQVNVFERSIQLPGV